MPPAKKSFLSLFGQLLFCLYATKPLTPNSGRQMFYSLYEGLDGGSGIHRSLKKMPIIHLIKMFAYSLKSIPLLHCKSLWGKVLPLLPLSINCNLLALTGGSMYSTCVRSVMLHAAETLTMTVATLNPLWRNDGSVMSRQRIELTQTHFSQSLASGTWMWCSVPVGSGGLDT